MDTVAAAGRSQGKKAERRSGRSAAGGGCSLKTEQCKQEMPDTTSVAEQLMNYASKDERARLFRVQWRV